ncbi:hypothetical protein CLV91_2675 [Maribacter vaceletii]|uniref:Uncharacterized protein n=1 Tax=Maribacter vaceletii TaxID=1206816 RepID=A0A495DTG3_9FLAO|nr:DUF6786 family protein [Maribacter vaceletii]RKR07914.1 hypothetical protein CLV91_2675 [Maribacter vaceletii]
MKKYFSFLFLLGISYCNSQTSENYNTVLSQLKEYTTVIELSTNNGKSRLIITPELQGRIITSSYDGLLGDANGWFNKNSITTKLKGGIGGEDRLWIGPLGSQYSFYYQQIKPLNETNWLVPNTMENEAYQLINQSNTEVSMLKKMTLTNHIGTNFILDISRKITILDAAQITNNLQISIPESLNYIAYESANSLVNIGTKKITKEKGLVSLWSAGMFNGSTESIVIIPLTKKGKLEDLYSYMGSLGKDRLQIKKNVVLYKADGQYRSKIGVPPHLAPSIYGCYSAKKERLTIVQYKKTRDSLYFNSNVSVQKEPYKGEVIPIYNNGTMDYSVTTIPSFFELESTSAMRELEVNDTLNHYHRVYHFSGNKKVLDAIAKKLLDISLKDVTLSNN